MGKDSKGFIKLDRSIFEHWIFQDAEKFKAFVDLIQLMRWKDEKLLIGNDVITIPRGSYYTSELKLSERWGWSRKRTREFLKLLENEKMITKKGTTKGTTLTLVNYGLYQDEGPTKGTAKEHQRASEGTTEDTAKEHQRASEGYTKEEIKESKRNYKKREERKEGEKITPTTPHLSFGLDLEELDEAHKLIAENVTETSYLTFFKPCDIKCEGNKIMITAPNKFTADCIKEKYVRQVSLLTGREIVVREV